MDIVIKVLDLMQVQNFYDQMVNRVKIFIIKKKKKKTLVFAEGLTDGPYDVTITPEAKYPNNSTSFKSFKSAL